MGTTDLLLSKLERELRPIARERIANGQMPREAPTGAGGRFGTGQPCALCDKPIQSDEIEYEVEPVEAIQMLRLHKVCHYAWQLECARVKQKPRGNPKNPPAGKAAC